MNEFEQTSERENVAKLEEALKEIEDITAEWRKSRDARQDEKTLSGRELPAVQKLAELTIPANMKDRVLKVISDFEASGHNDQRAADKLQDLKKIISTE